MITYINDFVKPVNDNKFLLALVMMFLNISSKYIDFGFSKTQEHALRNGIAREILIFCVLFVGTRDIVISAALTLLFFIFTEYLFNEDSKYCLCPQHFNRMKEVMQQKEGHVTEKELNAALETLKKAEKNNQIERQNKFIHFMNYNKL
jgi:hypothetical protein